MVEDATARIAPGPGDDPAEAGHPGAREAGVVDYIDMMLGTLSSLGSSSSSSGAAPLVFAGGPWSNCHTSGPDLMASFIALDAVRTIAWRRRLAGWQQQYRDGIATLDRLAGGDFTKAAPADQDQILARAGRQVARQGGRLGLQEGQLHQGRGVEVDHCPPAFLAPSSPASQ